MGSSKEREQCEATHGFALYTDVGSKAFAIAQREAFSPIAVSKIAETTVDQNAFTQLANVDASAMGLYTAMRAIAKTVPRPSTKTGRTISTKRDYPYNLSEKDIDRFENTAIHLLGLQDFNFTWTFASAMAVVVDDWWREKGLASEEQHGNSLSEWAETISTDWFSNILHDTAETAPGVHITFGSTPQDYSLSAAREHYEELLGDGDLLMLADSQKGGQLCPPLAITPVFKHNLTQKMREETRGSVGCPVAKHATVFASEAYEEDEHAKELVKQGRWNMELNRDGTKVRVSQERTVIDEALQIIALQLRTYEQEFGNPIAVYDETGKVSRIDHSKDAILYPPRPLIKIEELMLRAY